MAYLLRSRTLNSFTGRFLTMNRRVIGTQFHTALIQREGDESKDSKITSEIQKESDGLFDWKVTAPIGIAVAIPVLSNGVYVINEETQLACCFFLFCTSVYKFGGDMIASFFDAKSNEILREHNAAENASIVMARETLATHSQQTEVVQDLTAMQEAHKEVIQLMCKVESHKLRHEVRDTFQKNLDSIVAHEKDYLARMQHNMVEYATENVRDAISRGGKTVKDDAFKNAIDALSNEDSGEEKEDDIAKLFCSHLKQYAENLESKAGKVVQLSSDERNDIQAELDMYMKRHDMEAAKLEAPSEVTLNLIK